MLQEQIYAGAGMGFVWAEVPMWPWVLTCHHRWAAWTPLVWNQWWRSLFFLLEQIFFSHPRFIRKAHLVLGIKNQGVGTFFLNRYILCPFFLMQGFWNRPKVSFRISSTVSGRSNLGGFHSSDQGPASAPTSFPYKVKLRPWLGAAPRDLNWEFFGGDVYVKMSKTKRNWFIGIYHISLNLFDIFWYILAQAILGQTTSSKRPFASTHTRTHGPLREQIHQWCGDRRGHQPASSHAELVLDEHREDGMDSWYPRSPWLVHDFLHHQRGPQGDS